MNSALLPAALICQRCLESAARRRFWRERCANRAIFCSHVKLISSKKAAGAIMKDDVRQAFDARIRDCTDEQIEAEIQQWPQDSEERSILRDELRKRLDAADAPARQRFDKGYEQKERHHRALLLMGCIAAGVSLIGAAASWAAFWFTTHHSQPTAAQANAAPAVASPTPIQKQ